MNYFLRILFITLVIFTNQLQAKQSRELKLGGGLGFISVPEYIGSSSQRQYTLPYPYIYYKSDDITIEKNMLFGHLYNKKDFLINLSISGTLPVKSDFSSLRYNMKQLDPTLEVGPNFIYKLVNFNEKSFLSIQLPLRAVWSIDFPTIQDEGFVTNPNLHLKHYLGKTFKIELSTGPTYATKEYYNYFYEVKTEDVTANRTEYHSKTGYGGWKSTVGLSCEKNKIWYGAFVRYYDLKNTTFVDSPLVEENHALFYGMAMSYIF